MVVSECLSRPAKNLKRLGKWAVVTGATDGIGKAYADALARKGINIVLVSRTASKLEEAAAQLKTKRGVQTKVVTLDFSKAEPASWKELEASLEGLDIGVLINNVGRSYDHAEYFLQIDNDLISDLIKINIESIHKVTQIVLPGMKQRHRGAIVNIGSAASTVAPSGPLYAVYAATKAYVDMFSKSLDLEYRPYGISVQNQAPAFVATKMSKIRKATIDAPTPAKWAASAIRHIGYESSSCPYWFHAIMWSISASLPESVVSHYVLKMHKGLYRR
ncbi:hypothetical protein WJX73_007431 [Symbiochloris irregularis]|uniref:Uncharacterized protein n=1 Tax=Symbiochloris irregularis TaxID=706552 RepID=A0AAW1P6P6_9CHLO